MLILKSTETICTSIFTRLENGIANLYTLNFPGIKSSAIREAQILTQAYGMIDEIGGKQSLYAYMKAQGVERDPKDRINKVLKHLAEYPGGEVIRLSQVTGKWFKDFQTYLKSSPGLSAATANSYATAIRVGLRQAVRENLIPRDPSDGIKAISVPEGDKVFLSSPELQRMADVPLGGSLGADVKRAFLFACYTGLRISDLKSLTWGDVEHFTDQVIKRQKKTGRKVFVPLKDTAWKIINDGTIHKHTELIFPVLGKTATNTNQYLQAWAKKAGIEKSIGWHTARHTFAVLSLEAGADLYTVSKLLGHTKIATTQVYAKVTDKLKRAAVNALPGINLDREGTQNKIFVEVREE